MPPNSPSPTPLPSAAAVAAFAAGAALLAASAPLLAYAGTLALFGAPHALAELRYVDGRFGRRLRSGTGLVIAAILAIVVALRALTLAGSLAAADAYVVELGLVAVLAFAVVPDLASSPLRAALAVAVGACIAIGSAVAPWTTVVLLAVLHNATPVGFLAERLDDPASGNLRRRRAMRTCALLFVAVPALIATGLPSRALEAAGLFVPEAGFASSQPLDAHLRVFVPPALVESSLAPSLFAASSYLQILHYGIVIAILPRLLGPRSAAASASTGPILPWPRASWLTLGVAAVSALAVVGFVRDFAGTRAAYGLPASVHAWIEIPVLLLALAPRARGAAAASAATAPAADDRARSTAVAATVR